MKASRLVVASRNEALVREIQGDLGLEFRLLVANAASDIEGAGLDDCQLLLLDQDFTEARAIDVLMRVMQKPDFPVLMLAHPDDPKLISEALRLGAANYLLQGPTFRQHLRLAVDDALTRFRARQEAAEQLRLLQERASRMEVALGIDKESLQRKDTAVRTSRKKELLLAIGEQLRSGRFVLPSYPKIVERFRDRIEAGSPLPVVAAELERDVGIATRLIAIANSPRYRAAAPLRTVEQAMSRIGMRDATQMVEAAANRSLFASANPRLKEALNLIWRHSLATAWVAREIADARDLGDPAEYFSMGLLHDIGKVVLLQVVGDLERQEALGALNSSEFGDLLASHHGEFGRRMLERWNFPPRTALVVAQNGMVEQIEDAGIDAWVVGLASTAATAGGFAAARDEPVPALGTLPHLQRTGLGQEALEGILAAVTTRMQQTRFD